VTLACLDYPHLGPQVAAPGVRVVSVRGNFFAVRGRGWCPRFRRVLIEEAAKADIVHNHGLWMWPNAYAREAAVAAGNPLIISPRGMLEAWSLGRSKLRKAVAWRLFEKKNLQSAAMFHATAESERESILEASKRLRDEETKRPKVKETIAEVPIVVAPNGVDLPDLGRKPGREALEERFPELKGRRWVVFMSRLHPKKGVDVLLRAWARQNVAHGAWSIEHGEGESRRGERPKDQEPERSRTADSPKANGAMLSRGQTKDLPVLILAGSDLIGYRREVEKMVRELGVQDSVVITGELQGEMKDALLANAEVFVLPSYSENFGIVVAEAMAWGRPVIASTGTPWKEVAEVAAGWWVEPEEEPLAKALAEAMGKSPEEMEEVGSRGRALVAERYGWSVPAQRLLAAYKDLLATK
jgi:glycosyltransferase involved in cell wall biosynthesis